MYHVATPIPNKYYCLVGSASKFNDGSSPLRFGVCNVSTTGFDVSFKGGDSTSQTTEIGSLVVFGTSEVATEPPAGYDPWSDPSPPGGGIIP